MNHLLTPTSVGEVLDKITILQIKKERIADSKKLVNISYELELLTKLCIDNSITFESSLFKQLKETNEELWGIEDNIRIKEGNQSFDASFVLLARNVYFTNDRRARLKAELNKHFKCDLMEEKSYADYTISKKL